MNNTQHTNGSGDPNNALNHDIGVVVPPDRLAGPEWFENLKRTITPTHLVIGITLLIITVIAQNIVNPLSLFTQAATSTATIGLQPTNSTMPPGAAYQLWVTADQKVGFIRSSIEFDPTKLVLTRDVSVVTPGFTIISKTPMIEANTTGKIVIVAGLDVSQKNTAPTGSFQFATIPFAPKVHSMNSITKGHINLSDSQIIDTAASAFSLSSQDTTITIVGTSITPIPTLPSTVSATLVPTRIPTVFATATSVPSTGTPTEATTKNSNQSNSNPKIITTKLPIGIRNLRYSVRITATDININDTLVISSDDLPPGLTLKQCRTRVLSKEVRTTCILKGKPSQVGTYYPVFTVSDQSGLNTSYTLGVEIVTWRSFFRKFLHRF